MVPSIRLNVHTVGGCISVAVWGGHLLWLMHYSDGLLDMSVVECFSLVVWLAISINVNWWIFGLMGVSLWWIG